MSRAADPSAASSFAVPGALAGERIDRVVAMLTERSRAEAARLLASGAVSIGGRLVSTPSRRVALGDEVQIAATDAAVAAPAEAPVEASLPPLRLVFVDDDLIVLDKDAGVVVHPGAGRTNSTLVSQLLVGYPELASTEGIGEPSRPGIVHRLDKDTSGLLAVARTALAFDSLTGQLQRRSMGRTYRALALGHLGADDGTIEAPIGRSRRDRTRMAVTRDGRDARTSYHVCARFEEPMELSELEVRLETGRTHQIRVHLAAIGHPVLGDDRYGGRRRASGLERPFLHAEALVLTHPRSGEELHFRAPLPPDLVEMLARCQ